MAEKTIVILSVGRTGSSVLRALLDQTINDAFIQGENFLCTWWLYRYHVAMHRQILRPNREFDSYEDERSPFFARVRTEEVEDDLRRLTVRSITRGRAARVYGFKEIRWHECSGGNIDDVAEYFRFLSLYVSDVRLLISTRDPVELATSGWWHMDGTTPEEIARRQDWLLQLCDKGLRTFVVPHADIKVNNLGPMFEFLGEPFRPADVARVLATRHSF
jgi:hypothetical protein